MPNKKPKAIALLSGGLDSTLAAKIIKDQGVEVVGLHLASPFGCLTDVKKNVDIIGVPLLVRDKGEAYLDLVKNPRFGYGKNMNPCIDCRVFMFDFAEIVREQEKADFIITGEVMGQRPMSQHKSAIEKIDNESNKVGEILRPLSAKLFEPTVAEQKGWVDREKLLKIYGRGRREQIDLAEKLGIKEYEAPGGGCLLTEPSFSKRIEDYLEIETETGEKRLARSGMIRYGRYMRINDSLRVIVGRHQQDNEALTKGWKKAGLTYFEPENFLGPAAVAFSDVDEGQRHLIGQIIARYSKVQEAAKVIRFESEAGSGSFEITKPLEEEKIKEYIV